jgi:diguanylate cyclase (GGDEF)-like protein
MMTTISRLARTLGNPMDWSSVDKGILMTALMLPIYALYAFYGLLVLQLSTDGVLFDHDGARGVIDGLAVISVVNITICLLGSRLRRQRPESPLFKHLAIQFYAITLSWLGYQSGSLSVATGVVLAGSALVGFILFRPGPVVMGLVTAITILFGSSIASALGVLPYTPLLAPQHIGGETEIIWVLSMALLFAGPHFLVLLCLSAYVISRWHQREYEVKRLAVVDPLTDVANRRWIMAELHREMERSRRQRLPMSVVMVDLDHFKQINDKHGHQVGDRVLKTAAMVLSETVRQSDLVGRYGGEEFLILLPDTDAANARDVAERCRAQLSRTNIVVGGSRSFTISASFGVGNTVPGAHTNLDTLIHHADQALYKAKEEGRNRVVMSSAGTA